MRKPFKLPKFNFLGIGIVYIMLFVPGIWIVKIGYTGTTRGIRKRARSVSDAAPGVAIPIGFMIIPFAWHIEQAIHALLYPLRWNFYKGDGHTETFIFPGHIAILFVWLGLWIDYKIVLLLASFL